MGKPGGPFRNFLGRALLRFWALDGPENKPSGKKARFPRWLAKQKRGGKQAAPSLLSREKTAFLKTPPRASRKMGAPSPRGVCNPNV